MVLDQSTRFIGNNRTKNEAVPRDENVIDPLPNSQVTVDTFIGNPLIAASK